jgi:hypothetical protein
MGPGPYSRVWCDIRSRRPALHFAGDRVAVDRSHRGRMAANAKLKESEGPRARGSRIGSRSRRMVASSDTSYQQETLDQHFHLVQWRREPTNLLRAIFNSRCQALEVVDASGPYTGHERDAHLRTLQRHHYLGGSHPHKRAERIGTNDPRVGLPLLLCDVAPTGPRIARLCDHHRFTQFGARVSALSSAYIPPSLNIVDVSSGTLP